MIVLEVIDGGSPEREGMRGLTETNRGIVLGDVIIEVDGESISNEDDLLNVLEGHETGDVVEVVTRRDNRAQRYQIELNAAASEAGLLR